MEITMKRIYQVALLLSFSLLGARPYKEQRRYTRLEKLLGVKHRSDRYKVSFDSIDLYMEGLKLDSRYGEVSQRKTSKSKGLVRQNAAKSREEMIARLGL